MKEFEKWLETHKHANWTWEEDAKDAWKAALEWVLTQTTKGIEEDGTISNSDIIFGSKIREELEQ